MSNYNINPRSLEGRKYFSASHIMLFCILLMYILVGISSLCFIYKCIELEKFDNATQMLYALCSYSTICGSSTIVVYATKASKENNLKIANDRFKMKLELAKEIYSNIQNEKLDDKSIALIAILTEEDKASNVSEMLSNLNITIPKYNQLSNNSDIEGLG